MYPLSKDILKLYVMCSVHRGIMPKKEFIINQIEFVIRLVVLNIRSFASTRMAYIWSEMDVSYLVGKNKVVNTFGI